MSKGWDSGMLKKLKSLVGKGLSTAEMGKKLGMSKNAVVGKLNRLGWNAKASEVVDKKSSKTTKTAKKEIVYIHYDNVNDFESQMSSVFILCLFS